MLKEKATVFKRLMQVADVAIITLAFFAAYYFARHELLHVRHYLVFLPVIAAFWMALFNFFGMYWSFRTEKLYTIVFIVFETAGLSFMAFGSLLYVLKIEDVSRFFVLSIFIIAGAAMMVEKLSLILFFRFIRKHGKNYRNILIIGTGTRAQKIADLIDTHPEWGIKIVGLLDEDLAKRGEFVKGHIVIGSMIDLPEIIHNNVVDEVIFVVPRSWLVSIEGVIVFLETEGVRIHIAEDIFNLKHARFKQTDFQGFPMLTIESTPDKLWQLYFKSFFDFALSGLALLILSPVFAVIAVAIKLNSVGPVFFRQERVGLNGRVFTLFKFRTMEKDAEMKLSQLLAQNEMKGPAFKLANDPRVTPVGAFLRKFSLDELPQLWNVFSGDMSLVGPRPPLPAEVKEYDSWQRRRLSMKPGITCIWQCSGRNKIIDFDEWASLDLDYIDKWSLWLDFKIALKTVPAVLFGIGAK
jgi:exopolysaccharide biosynthesis polyprenyl glycosylphosphotransferase